jgi:small-conductance mechanosensitive channel/CRP-like cAMP-binding protein
MLALHEQAEVAGLVAVAIALLWLRRRLHDAGLRRTALVGLILAVTTLVWLLLPALGRLTESAALQMVVNSLVRLFGALWWVLCATLVIVMLERYVWAALNRRGVAVPKLMIDLARALVIVFTGLGIVSAIFEESIAGLLAASGVVAVVMGFALQSTLADVFSGIAINMQRPYRVGDWVQVDEGVLGEVIEMNWRATHLLSPHGNVIVLPNSKMAAAQLINFNHPTRRQRQSIAIALDARVAPAEAKAVLEAGALRCSRVLVQPVPAAAVQEFRDYGQIAYELFYWIEDFPLADAVRQEVADGIWHALDTLGLAPWHGRDDARDAATGQAERLLGVVHLFATLPADLRRRLAPLMHAETHTAGHVVVEQGDQDARLFIVERGALEVSVAREAEAEAPRQVLARLGSGDCFGEMALLTGEKRGARVTALCPATLWVIEPADLAPLLREQPALAETLGRIVAERRLANEAALAALSPADRAAAIRSGTAEIFARMRAFFGL